MSSGRPHPFPPVVRWVVFPALAVLAGAAGSVAIIRESDVAVIGALLSLSAAVCIAITSKPLPGLVGVPFVGLFLFCGGFAAFQLLWQGRSNSDAWDVAQKLWESKEAAALFLAVTLAQAVGHYLSLIRKLRLGPSLLLYAGLGFLVGAIFVPIMPHSNPKPAETIGFSAATCGLQAFAMEFSRILARRLTTEKACSP